MKTNFLYLFAAFLLGAVLITSCTEDDPTSGLIGPGTSITTNDSEIDPMGSFTVNLQAQSGDNLMDLLLIQKDGVNVSLNDITIDGSPAFANPSSISGDDQNFFDKDITVQTDLIAGLGASYLFTIRDAADQTSTETVFIFAREEVTPPTLTRDGGTGALTVTTQQFSVKLAAVAGSSDLSTLEVQEDGVTVDASRIDVASQTMLTNPIAISVEDAQGFTDWQVDIRSGNTNSATYTFILTDAAGETAMVSREVNWGTPLETIQTQLSLFNQAGPTGTGGVNLITGASVGSSDPSAHLVDKGIDGGPLDQNWLQQIAPGAATTTLKAVTSLQPEGFTYDAVDTKEAIIAAFNTETSSIGSEGSARVEVGNMFVLQYGADADQYMIVRIDGIVTTADDNSDYYEISAKF